MMVNQRIHIFSVRAIRLERPGDDDRSSRFGWNTAREPEQHRKAVVTKSNQKDGRTKQKHQADAVWWPVILERQESGQLDHA